MGEKMEYVGSRAWEFKGLNGLVKLKDGYMMVVLGEVKWHHWDLHL